MSQEELTINNLFGPTNPETGRATCQYCYSEVAEVYRHRHLMYHLGEISSMHAASMSAVELFAAKRDTTVLLDVAEVYILRAIKEITAAKVKEA